MVEMQSARLKRAGIVRCLLEARDFSHVRLHVAQYIFTEYKKISGHVIDETKLQQLLYLVQRESLALLNKPMFSENFEGWGNGPVCREIFVRFTQNGIQDASCFRKISEENKHIAKNIISQYGVYEPWVLRDLLYSQ